MDESLNLAPVAIFAYNRPMHLKSVLKALEKNDLASKSEIYIFCDGPRPDASPEAIQNILAVASVCDENFNFRSKQVIKSDYNKGLAQSVYDGVDYLFKKHTRIIVLEDDVLTNSDFLYFLNSALDKYNDDETVMQISGYWYPIKADADCAFFLPAVTCWGWATWKRSWIKLNRNVSELIFQIENNKSQHKFDLENSYPYFETLKLLKEKKIDSWAILWYASIFLNNGLVLYPPFSLTQNIGMDGSGIHYSAKDDRFLNPNWDPGKKINSLSFPETIATDFSKLHQLVLFFRKSGRSNFMSGIRSVIKYILHLFSIKNKQR